MAERRDVPPQMQFAGERIDAWRRASKMSQEVLAGRVGLKQPTVNAFLKGREGLSLPNIEALADVFGRTLSDVFAGRAPKATKYSDLVTAWNSLPNDQAREDVLRIMRGYAGMPRPDGDQPSGPH